VKRLLLAAVLALACQRSPDGDIEQHGSGGPPGHPDPGPAPNGEYGNDPGAADAGTGPQPDAQAVTPNLPIEELAAAVAHTVCKRRADCCTGDGGASDPATCEPNLTELLQPFAASLGRAIAMERVSYDGQALDVCLATLAAATCADAHTFEPLLLSRLCPIAVPLSPAGAACQASYECVDGFCQGSDLSRDGRCVSPKLPDGQPCDRGDDCASGACHPTLDVCAPPEPTELCR
jgi:hypothetical protein